MKPQITFVPVDELKPYANNAKLHPKKQVQQIANSIKQFGFIAPIVTDTLKNIIAGHGRLEAAKLLGLKEIPIISITHLTEAEVKAYRLADNQLTMNSGYDDGLLKIEINELMSIDLDFDIEITGFETAEIDIIIDGNEVKEQDPADDIPEVDKTVEPITKLGDIFQLGKHRLICGDSLKPETYQALMQDLKATTIFTDPPYNVKIDGHVCGNGKISHREFAMASGEMSEQQFVEFLRKFIKLSIQFSNDGALHYICMDWRHMLELLTAGKEYTELKNICIWNKNNGGMGSL